MLRRAAGSFLAGMIGSATVLGLWALVVGHFDKNDASVFLFSSVFSMIWGVVARPILGGNRS